jgi:non-specific serine/threonine protein kinase
VLSIWCELSNRPHIGMTLVGLGSLASAQGKYVRAARLLGAAETLRESAGAAISRPELEVDARYDLAVAGTRQHLGASAYARALAAGRALDLADVVDEALVPSQTSVEREVRSSAEADRLSARELEIATLMARGYSNREIASELVIAPRTVDTHVGHVLSKLGLRTRAQVAAWAVGSGLVAGWRR